VENFLIVQYVELRSKQQSNKSAQIRSCPPNPPSSGTAAWPRCEVRRDHFVRKDARNYRNVMQTNGKVAPQSRARRGVFQKPASENERPVRGDNRTGQAIWALGVDGRSRRIQPMGRDYRSHTDKSQHPRRTFKTPGDFFNLVFGGNCRKITAQRAVWQRLRSIFQPPWMARRH
jgi:hypothetical protein